MSGPRYSAFLSYSHADTRWARWLHHRLETFRVPAKLVGVETALGPVARKLAPVFRDRDELPASGDLGQELRGALAAAGHLIVLCSPAAARSRWVNEEVLAFKRVHGDTRVLALIVEGEPGDAARDPFPPALRFRSGPGGLLTTEPAEVIAADARIGGDGKRLALMKLLAGLTGLELDQLVRRNEARSRRRLALLASLAGVVATVGVALAIYANAQRAEAVAQRRVADAQRRTAEASLDFLIGTFEIANPATENPRTISAVTMLQRVGERVKTDLKDQPAVQVRLLRATGDILLNLGLMKDARRELEAALAAQRAPGPTRAMLLLRLARVARQEGDLPRAASLLAAAGRSYARGPGAAAAAVDASLAEERAQLMQLQGDPVGAVRTAQRAVELFGKLPGDHRLDLARVLSAEGKALSAAGRWAEADAVLVRAQALFTAVYGPQHVRVAVVLQDRAVNALDAGELSKAEKFTDRFLTIFRSVLDENHPTFANSLLLAGRIAHAQGDYQEAEMLMAQARQKHILLFGPLYFYVGDDEFYIARVLSDQGRYGSALSATARAKRVYDAVYGPLDADQAELLMVRAQIHRASGDRANAEHDCAAAIALNVKLRTAAAEVTALRERCAKLTSEPARVPLLFSATP